MSIKQKNWGYIAGWLSVILNIFLFTVKYWVGLESDSIAMIADAWHTLSDTLTSIIVIIGFWISSKPPDHEHPYGHGRAESIAAIIIATLLGIVAFEFISDGISRLMEPKLTTYTSLALIIFAISVILKEIMAQFSFKVGNKLNSESLKADGWHHRSDAITTLIVVLGAFFGSQIWWIDGIMGIIVAVAILYAAFEILKTSASTLLGEKPDEILFKEIELITLNADKRISDVHNLQMHSYGDNKEMTLHIRLPKDLTVIESHNITLQVENLIFCKKGIRLTVHVDPQID